MSSAAKLTCRNRIEKAQMLKETVLDGGRPNSFAIEAAHVDPAVVESWIRMVEVGAKPAQMNQRIAALPIDPQAQRKSDARVVEIAESVFGSFIQRDANRFCSLAVLDSSCKLLFAMARGSSLISFLKESGVVSSTTSDSMLLTNSAGGTFFYSNLDYSESAIGTTSWSVCMHTQKPVQLVNSEQFSEALTKDNQIITAIPILDPNGQVEYIVAYCHFLEPSALDTDYSTHAKVDMDFVGTMAGEIEARMRFYNPDMLSMAARRAIRSHGRIVADATGNVIKMNDFARNMLGIGKTSRRYNTIEKIFANTPAFCELVKHGGRYEMRANVLNSKSELTVSAEAFTVATSVEGCSIVIRLFDDSSPEPLPSLQANKPVESFSGILGNGASTKRVKELCSQFAISNENILLVGESGTGKELYARAIHAASRPNGPFVAFSAATIPSDLILPSLFGYEPETLFPNQTTGRPGFVERANHGTLFLDEIADIPIPVQASLLRVLETKRVMRVGGIDERLVDFRIIATTGLDTAGLIRHGRLRRDFFHRVSVLTATIPPLRDRIVDIRPIAQRHLETYCQQMSMPLPTTEEAFYDALENYDWPGNVRQLHNAITYAVNVALAQGDSSLTAKHLPDPVLGKSTQPQPVDDIGGYDDSDSFNLSKIERQTILRAWRKTDGDTARMSALLGISVSTLNRRLKQYELRK